MDNRKLAAVLFADIEGYTSFFQKNESAAFSMVEQHRLDLQAVAEKHSGQIVKYYGDGSLTLFSSVIEAARGAIDLQVLSRTHDIPLRIGIHMGEMIEKDNDVYGDAVNVASRIQAVGISGSVLVSKIVEDELKNHPGITTKSLGFTTLKNVKKPIEVFALANAGLAIPHHLPGKNKALLIRGAYLVMALILLVAGILHFKNKRDPGFTSFGNECVIIPPFVSSSPHSGMEYFGSMASYELIKALSESAKVNTIPYNTMLLNTNANLASFRDNPALSRRLGADIEVRGVYTLEGPDLDTLRISLSLLDLHQNRLFQYPIQDVLCPAADKRACLEEIKNILVGYWKSKSAHLFHITSDSAYANFLIAQNKWADPNNQEEIKSYLLKAITQDPKFIDAWFLLLDLFHNEEAYAQGLDTLEVIETLFPDPDQRQQDFLGYYKADFQGNNVQAFQSFLKEYKRHPNDLFVNNTGMVMAYEYLNDPQVTIQMFNQLEPDSMDLSTCAYCLTRFNIALKAYLDLFDTEKAGKLAQRIKPYALKSSHYIGLLKYYVVTQDTISINSIIHTAAATSKHNDEEAYLSLITARIAALGGHEALKDQYAAKAIRLYKKIPSINLARCYLLTGRLKEAEALYMAKANEPNPESSTFAYLGIIYAKEGNSSGANAMITKLNTTKQQFDFGYTSYAQGRIKANLGEYDAALQYFNLALDEGIRFLPTSTFLNDPDLVMMNSNPAYLRLLTRNRINNIE